MGYARNAALTSGGGPEARAGLGAGGSAPRWRPTAEQASFLAELTDILAQHDLSSHEILEKSAADLAALVGDSCLASPLSDDGRWLQPYGLADNDREVADVLRSVAVPLRPDRGFARQVMRTCRAIRLPETSPELIRTARPELGPYLDRFGVRSLIVAPMRLRGRAVGTVAVLRRASSGGRPYTEHDERLVQLVADWLGLAIENVARASPAAARSAPGGTSHTPLSDRECEVLALVARGYTNREIAARLVLSVRTVEWHRARLKWKLGVSGRAALVEQARVHGLAE